jgi:hypothetical protein|tara:strand:+ start:410 stop:625 length:216 start_codon:yes stop_codon:yes gene_type:complete
MEKMKGRKIDRNKWNWKDISNNSVEDINKVILENNRYRQGRSKEQVESSYLGASIAISALIFLVLMAIIFS